jgi:hypothetical protein
VNSATINVGVEVFLLYAAFDSFKYVLRNGKAGSYSNEEIQVGNKYMKKISVLTQRKPKSKLQ